MPPHTPSQWFHPTLNSALGLALGLVYHMSTDPHNGKSSLVPRTWAKNGTAPRSEEFIVRIEVIRPPVNHLPVEKSTEAQLLENGQSGSLVLVLVSLT